MNRLFAGTLSGLIATVPMTAFMDKAHKQLPPHEKYPLPPREITEKITEDIGVKHQLDESQHKSLALTAHFAYGAAVGAIYGLIAPRLPLPTPLNGITYSLAVWAGSYLGLLPKLEILKPATEHPARRTALMIGAHVIWGSTMAVLMHRMTKD